MDKKYTIVLPRSTSLYGLKREVRSVQLQSDSVEIEDFELVDVGTGSALGIQGNDSLPPSDLGFLFISRESIMQSTRATQMIGGLLQTDYLPAWRKSLASVPDGLELCQLFVTPSGSFNPEEIEPMETEMSTMKKLNSLAHSLNDPNQSNEDLQKTYAEFSGVLAYANNNIGFNAHKLYWDGHFHPLMSVVASLNTKLPFQVRARALGSLGWIYVRELLRPRFLLNVLVRALLSNGFFLTFSRLTSRLLPLLVRTQLKQIIDAEIDWVPILFAIRFAIKVSYIFLKSYLPVVGFQVVHSASVLLLRLIVNKESRYDNALVSLCLVGLELMRSRRRQRAMQKALGYVAKQMPINTPSSRFRFLLQKSRALVSLVRSSFATQYAMSDLAWSALENKFDPSMTISLPVYAYAVPFFVTMCLVRIRMSISDSYYCVLYL